jgi:hypothetical protein
MPTKFKEDEGKKLEESNMRCPRKQILAARSCRGTLFTLALLVLGACTPQYSRDDWTGLVSKWETLRFMALASCHAPDFLNPVAVDAAFFKISRLEPVRGEPWTYNAELVGVDGVRRGNFVVSQWWTASGVKTAPWSVIEDHQFCNVLAEVPASRDGRHPYYVEPEATKKAEYSLLTPVTPISLLLLVLITLALVLSFWGFEHLELWFKWAGTLLAMIGVSAVVYFFCVEAPWLEYQKALTYLKYFDQLPHTAGGDLLPISPQQFAYVAAGPPHPHSTQFHYEVFAWVAGGLISLWLLVTSPFVVMGVYWLAVPLPLEELHQRALRAGRAPTAAETTAAVLKACTGKAAWQHRIMQRKADAFARNLNEIAQHL